MNSEPHFLKHEYVPCLSNLYAEHIMSYKLESRLAGETSTTSDIQVIPL